jgi:hypothetical protein
MDVALVITLFSQQQLDRNGVINVKNWWLTYGININDIKRVASFDLLTLLQ